MSHEKSFRHLADFGSESQDFSFFTEHLSDFIAAHCLLLIAPVGDVQVMVLNAENRASLGRQ